MEHGVMKKHVLTLLMNDVSPTPPGISFPRPAWVKLNRLRVVVGLFRLERHNWGLASTTTCECDAKEDTAEHIITPCLIYHHPNEFRANPNVSRARRPG